MTDEPKYKTEGKEIQGIVQTGKIEKFIQIFKGNYSDKNNPLMVLVIIVITSFMLTKIFLSDRFLSVVKTKGEWEILLSSLAPPVICIAFILSLSKAYRNISKALIFFVLIPLFAATTSLVAAWYILEKPSFPDLVRPLIPFLSKLPPSEAVPPNPSVSDKPPIEPGKDSVKPGESSDMTGEKSDKPGEISEPQSGTKPGMKDQTGSKESSSRLGDHIFNALGMKFVYIPPGTFMMGSPESELRGRASFRLVYGQHRVTLTQGFYMQTTEVTQKQWRDVMGNNPSFFKECGDDCPVEQVSWNDVQRFIEKLNLDSARLPVGERSRTYRLPTEAEWEYAARAGSETYYCFGDDAAELGEYAWYIENSGGKTHPVAQKQPNKWGLYDMHGNIWEWCQDWDGGYHSADVTDPTGPHSGSYRVNRGGSWGEGAQNCRSAYRFMYSPGSRLSHFGFRLVLLAGQHKSEP